MEADRAEALAARLAPQPIAAEDAPTRRPAALLARLAPAGHGPLVSAHGADLLLATAYGALGAFIGAGLWCVVATLAHALLGPLGLVMAFLTGKGTAMTATFRSSALVLVAVALTALSWDVCAALLTSQGAALSPLDAVFCLISLFVAAAPVDFLPRRPA